MFQDDSGNLVKATLFPRLGLLTSGSSDTTPASHTVLVSYEWQHQQWGLWCTDPVQAPKWSEGRVSGSCRYNHLVLDIAIVNSWIEQLSRRWRQPWETHPMLHCIQCCFWLESTLISNLGKFLSYTNHWAQEQSFRALTDAQRAAQPKVVPQYPWGPGWTISKWIECVRYQDPGFIWMYSYMCLEFILSHPRIWFFPSWHPQSLRILNSWIIWFEVIDRNHAWCIPAQLPGRVVPHRPPGGQDLFNSWNHVTASVEWIIFLLTVVTHGSSWLGHSLLRRLTSGNTWHLCIELQQWRCHCWSSSPVDGVANGCCFRWYWAPEG